ncbi:response regulator [Paenibacillus sp. SYP-B3998]|uniref:histidine kinase n=1 Tax=Paenibacillus sp. SYP-B3998 TaxID=2678564 RepID=A0A6G3ZUD6_9BACL|nr:response regulator [Paenibacillus sp. SYP-B3998]NEW05752.1 response regulator [Paenibacillus sp. SYP-B3998]
MKKFAFLIVICLAIIYVLSVGKTIWNKELSEARKEVKLVNWAYVLGDMPFQQMGQPEWTSKEAQANSEWRQVKAGQGFHDTPKSAGSLYWLTTKLPNQEWRDPSLFLLIYGNYEIYLDHKLIYRYGELNDDGKLSYHGTPNRLITLPQNIENHTLFIRVQATRDRVGTAGTVWYGNKSDIVLSLIKEEFFPVALSVLYALSGCTALFFYIKSRKYLELFGFGWFTTCFGVYMFARIDFKDFYLDAPLFWSWVELLSLFLGTAGFIYFAEQVVGAGRWFILRILWMLILLYIIGVILLCTLGFFSIQDTLFPFQILMILAAILTLGVVVLQVRKENKEAQWVLLCIVEVTVCGLHDVLSYSLFVTNPISIVHVGLFVQLFFLCLVLRYRLTNALLTYAEKLERTNGELSRYDQLKDHFLATTSHELRTPLHGIIGLAQSLLDETQGQARRKLEVIVTNGKRLNTLVEQILQFKSLKEPNLVLTKSIFNLRTTIENMLLLLEPLKKPNVRFLHVIPDISIYADEGVIQQILNNLIGNALKFTESGYIRITATYEQDQLFLSVEDTGKGIPQDQWEFIFEEFYQSQLPKNRHDSGTGLGLPITKRLLMLHGGNISFQSRLGLGTTFICSIKADVLRENECNHKFVPDYSAAVFPFVHAQQATILVVDDEEMNLQVIESFLNKVPQWKLVFASSGEEAISLASSIYPDLILMDVMMPGQDGFEVCQLLRETPPVEDLKIILLTAKGMEAAGKGYKVGADEYLTKPIDRMELIHRVHAHLQARWFMRKERQRCFTDRQVEFLKLAFEHQAENKEALADKLYVKYETIKKDVKKINQHFASRTFTEAAVIAKRSNII